MKHIVRALKYFIQLAVVLVVFVLLLSAFNLVGGGVNGIFREGMRSVGKIALILALFSLIYPFIGYGKRSAGIRGSFEEIRPRLLGIMQERGYRLEKEEGENLTFVKTNALQRLLSLYEDRLTFTRSFSGFTVEGHLKNVTRVISAIRFRLEGE